MVLKPDCNAVDRLALHEAIERQEVLCGQVLGLAKEVSRMKAELIALRERINERTHDRPGGQGGSETLGP